MRRCKDCLAGGTELVLMKTGRTRSEEDECPICNLPLPFDDGEVMLKICGSQTRHEELPILPGTSSR